MLYSCWKWSWKTVSYGIWLSIYHPTAPTISETGLYLGLVWIGWVSYRLEGTVHDVSKGFIASSGIFVTEFPRTCIPSPWSWPPQKPWFSGRWWWNHIFATSYLIFRWFEGWELLSSLRRRWDPTRLGKILTKPEFGTTEGVQEWPWGPWDPGTLGTPEPVASIVGIYRIMNE